MPFSISGLTSTQPDTLPHPHDGTLPTLANEAHIWYILACIPSSISLLHSTVTRVSKTDFL